MRLVFSMASETYHRVWVSTGLQVLEDRASSDEPAGLVAYHDGEPGGWRTVGWCIGRTCRRGDASRGRIAAHPRPRDVPLQKDDNG